MNSAVRTPFKIHDENSISSFSNFKSGKKVAFQSSIGPNSRDGAQSVTKNNHASAHKSSRKALSSLSTSQVNARTGGTAVTPGGKGTAIGLKDSNISGIVKKSGLSGIGKELFNSKSAALSIKLDGTSKNEKLSGNKLAMKHFTSSITSSTLGKPHHPIDTVVDEEMLCSGVRASEYSPFERAMAISQCRNPQQIDDNIVVDEGLLDEDVLANFSDEQWQAIDPEQVESLLQEIDQTQYHDEGLLDI